MRTYPMVLPFPHLFDESYHNSQAFSWSGWDGCWGPHHLPHKYDRWSHQSQLTPSVSLSFPVHVVVEAATSPGPAYLTRNDTNPVLFWNLPLTRNIYYNASHASFYASNTIILILSSHIVRWKLVLQGNSSWTLHRLDSKNAIRTTGGKTFQLTQTWLKPFHHTMSTKWIQTIPRFLCSTKNSKLREKHPRTSVQRVQVCCLPDPST